MEITNISNAVATNDSRIIIIDSYAHTKERLDILRKCIDSFKRKNYHVMLVSHIFVPEDIVKSLNYFIYDDNNSFNNKNPTLYFWANYPEYDMVVNFVPPLSKGTGHEYPIVRSMKNSLSLAVQNKYNTFCFTEFDNIYDDQDMQKIDEILKDLEHSKNDFFLFSGKDHESYKYFETIFFCGNTISALIALNSYFPNDLNSFNEKFTFKYPPSLEHFFYEMLPETKYKLSTVESKFVDYFNSENKNISSMADVYAFILSNQNDGYYIIVSNTNKIDFTVKIKLENELLYEKRFSSSIHPALKLEKEGIYLSEFYTEAGELYKSQKLDFYHNSKQKYIPQGKIVIKT